MGEHDTWYTLLPQWHALEQTFSEGLRRDWRALMFQDTHFTLVHVGGALIAALLIIIAALRYRAYLNTAEQDGLIPPRKFGLAAMTDGFVSAVYNVAVDVLGEEDAKKYLPLLGALALFIFCCNLQSLVPGFVPPTDTLKTNLALSLSVFVAYNVMGIWRNGFTYLAHFLGPKIGGFYWLFPIMLPIEIISHLARPLSLSLRLMGNIMADHKVVGVVLGLVALIVPVPFLLLGTMVVIVQTFVFTLLTMIYIGMAVAHHDEAHEGAH